MLLFEVKLFSYWISYQTKVNKCQFKDRYTIFIVIIELLADKYCMDEEKLYYDLLLLKRLKRALKKKFVIC